jgi:hypothetical protein
MRSLTQPHQLLQGMHDRRVRNQQEAGRRQVVDPWRSAEHADRDVSDYAPR